MTSFINNKYTYDALSNILAIQNNSVALPTDTQIGGRSIQNYTYDDLNRLETATGTFLGRNDQTLNPGAINYASQNYSLAMSYDNQHNIVAKNQLHRKATTNGSGVVQGAWSKVEKSSYGLVYEDYNTAGFTGDKAVQFEGGSYEYNQPHAPRKIVDQPDSSTPNCCDAANDPRVKVKTYDYDHNGNQTKVSQTTCNTPNATVLRKNLWDEENRLRAIDLNPEATNVHPIAIYTYDAGGERIIKHNSTNVAIYENALKVGEKNQTDFMLYPSGMLVARPAADGSGGITYTKHYFAGTQRVSSKIGTTTNLGKFLEEWQQQEQSSPSYPAITTQAQMDNANSGATNVFGPKGFNFTNPPIITGGNTSLVAIPVFLHGGNEHDHYFFHPDHLGSSNYITNFVGEVSQHSEYFAFGETFIEEHKNSHNSPYKFNGKELDEESGLYYYGARYYDPRISIWASVDPLVEKTMSAYGYCYQNPLNLTDPTGMAPEEGGGDDPPKQINVIAIANYTNKPNDEAMNNALIAAKKTDAIVFTFNDFNDFKTKMKANVQEGTVANLTLIEHGGYGASGIEFGSDYLSSPSQMKELGGAISPYLNKDVSPTLMVLACNFGAGKNPEKSIVKIQTLADASGATVIAPKTKGLTYQNMFNTDGGTTFYPILKTALKGKDAQSQPNANKYLGKWIMMIPKGNNWNMELNQKDVFIDKRGNIRTNR